ncbi:ribonuclease [Micromonospora sp. 15K316]|uniref:ribonuclease n=1 Tax=Micromonospora sp. 15K316 TaxID=2530376 RepID=UPI00105172EF|nr:ribonuclease [Micromonospora sp. 15K316]TDC29071.1 ribonuclease [Micromonospora sp. 15K316]
MSTPEKSRRQQEDEALERGEAYQDVEGRRTEDPGAGAAHARGEADRNAEHLRHGEVGPGAPAQ